MVFDQDVTTLIYDFDGTLFHLPVDWSAIHDELGVAPGVTLGPELQRFMDDGEAAALAVVTKHERAVAARGSFTAGARACLTRPGNRAIVTRNSREAVLDALGKLAEGIFIVGREDVRRLKPDPEGVRLVLEHFGVKPTEAALIGDTYHDVQAARAAGVRSVIVHNPLLEYAPAGADRYLDDLTAIASVRNEQ